MERRAVQALIRHIVGAIEAAPAFNEPFYHLVLNRIFPEDVYAAMMDLMPTAADYRALPGRRNVNIREDGSATRVKIDLFPEYTRHLPPPHRALWSGVGRALCSNEVKEAFVRRMAPGLERRFGADFGSVDLYPIPMLTRDTSGYRIPEHTDTHWKGITVQLYLPRDSSIKHVGTVFSERLPDGTFRRVTQMSFEPNHGYAFAVGDNTWHSADAVGSEVASRDSILHTYFVDAGLLRFLRNRGKRIGNFILNEVRHVTVG